MHVLIQIREKSSNPEFREFSKAMGVNVHISHSSENSIHNLSLFPIKKAVINIGGLRDAAILKYINDYYPEIEVIVIANKSFDALFSILQKGNYSVLHEPLKLSELKDQLIKSKEISN